MKLDEARALLGLQPGADETAVRSAYARAVKADHPDLGGTGALIARLKVARDTLLLHRDIPACKMCKGSGRVQSRFGVQVCIACKGSGDQL